MTNVRVFWEKTSQNLYIQTENTLTANLENKPKKIKGNN